MFRGPHFIMRTMQAGTSPIFKRLWYDWTGHRTHKSFWSVLGPPYRRLLPIAYAKSEGIEAKLKGDRLIIDGKVYKYEDLDDLPYNLSMERAKLIPVTDGSAFNTTMYFQAICTRASLTWETIKHYKTNEHYYQSQCAAFHKEYELEKKIIKAKDGYEAMRLAKKIKISEEWEKQKPVVMARGVALKFE